jgi:hypothetical protein
MQQPAQVDAFIRELGDIHRCSRIYQRHDTT